MQQSRPSFHDQVIAILPKLRVQALALTRNRAAAEDLVQDAVCNALSAAVQSSSPAPTSPPGCTASCATASSPTCASAGTRPTSTMCRQHAFATEAPHEDRLALKELGAAMNRLPADQREALLMVVVHGMSYEALAEATGCAVGTAKSRVFRARRQLESWLLGESKPKALPAPTANALAVLRSKTSGDRSRIL